MAKRKRSDSPDRSTWSTVDLLEFVWPTIMVMLFFMVLISGLSNAPLVALMLNGQGHFMVRA
jgi:chromate transport protein ChrA